MPIYQERGGPTAPQVQFDRWAGWAVELWKRWKRLGYRGKHVLQSDRRAMAVPSAWRLIARALIRSHGLTRLGAHMDRLYWMVIRQGTANNIARSFQNGICSPFSSGF